jgi:hypothetical protein
MGNQFNFDQQPDETPEAWLSRLQVVSLQGMTMYQRFSHQHGKEQAERLVKGARNPREPIRKGETLPRMPQPDSVETGCDAKGPAGRGVILAVLLIVALALVGGIILTAAIIRTVAASQPAAELGRSPTTPRTAFEPRLFHPVVAVSQGLISSWFRGRGAARPG